MWYNNLTALAKSKISTPERTLYHKLRISKEIRPAAGASVAAQGARDYGIMNPSIMIAALPRGKIHCTALAASAAAQSAAIVVQ